MPTQRSCAIDVFRGLAVIAMTLANFLAGIDWIPARLKHAQDIGFTIIDLVAPLFIFAIGLTYGASARRHLKKDGGWPALQHFITRYLFILGLGALLSAGEIALQVDNQTINWGVLQAIGAAGLICLPFILTPIPVRLIAGLALLGGYQYLLDRYWLAQVLVSPHGGFYGSLGWAAMLLLASGLADLTTASPRWPREVILLCLTSLACAGVISIFWVPISKHRVSASYVLLSLGLSGLIYIAVRFLCKDNRGIPGFLALYGRHPLALYVFHLLLIGIVFLPGIPALYSTAPVWLAVLEAAVILILMAGAAHLLDKRPQKKTFS